MPKKQFKKKKTWPSPLKKKKKKGRDEVYKYTPASHLPFLSSSTKRAVAGSTIKITPKTSKATRGPLSAHV